MIVKQTIDSVIEIVVDSFCKMCNLNNEAALLTLLSKNRLVRKATSKTLR